MFIFTCVYHDRDEINAKYYWRILECDFTLSSEKGGDVLTRLWMMEELLTSILNSGGHLLSAEYVNCQVCEDNMVSFWQGAYILRARHRHQT